ncbi:restriction endonuclease subunit S [Photobacterium damselae]|uniref:restriction endonuclease subunit S n=1 Tax=Photobacterium damselae TaxID=38293 RepID=UPI00165D8DC8|nr:restriction endonuclease subunit S [Photobacterium damselae]
MSNLLPNGWDIRNIESLLDKVIDYRGKSPPKSDYGVPLITAKNIRKGYINEDPREYICVEQFNSWMTKGLPESGDIFITTEAPLGNVARVPNYLFAIGQRVLTLRANKDVLDSEFLLHVMQGQDFIKKLDLQSTGSTVAGIKQSTFRQLLLKIPPLHEQQKIAAILTSVDDVIEKTQVQINKLKDLKTGMMQELLTRGVGVDGKPHTEFKDSPVGRIPKSWEVLSIIKALDRVIDYRGKSPPKSEAGIPLLTAKNIRKGYINEEPREYIPVHKYDEWMVRGIPSYGDVFITTEAPLGNVAKVPKYKLAIGQRVLALCPKKSVIDTDYLLFVMQGEYFVKQLDLQSTGSTVAGIKQSTFKNIMLAIPSLEEQRFIANCIESNVIKSTTLDKKLDLLKNTKKALMQDLLTGKVRVNVD